jgi:hypothetical protein
MPPLTDAYLTRQGFRLQLTVSVNGADFIGDAMPATGEWGWRAQGINLVVSDQWT